MRISNIAGLLGLAGALAVGAIAPVSAAPLARAGAARIDSVPVQFAGWHRGGAWHGGWRWGPYPYAWRDAYDAACSGDHPPWTGAYAGYPSFWCSPGFGAYYRHWP